MNVLYISGEVLRMLSHVCLACLCIVTLSGSRRNRSCSVRELMRELFLVFVMNLTALFCTVCNRATWHLESVFKGTVGYSSAGCMRVL